MVIYSDKSLCYIFSDSRRICIYSQKNSMVQKAVCGRHRCGGITEYFHSAGNGFDSYFT